MKRGGGLGTVLGFWRDGEDGEDGGDAEGCGGWDKGLI